MLRMLVLKDHFLAKIRPAISPDIHDNIIEKNKGGGGRRPPPPLFLGLDLPVPNYIVMNIRRDGQPNFCQKMIIQTKHSKHLLDCRMTSNFAISSEKIVVAMHSGV